MTAAPDHGDPLIEDIEWLTTCLRRVMQRLDPGGVSAAVGRLEAACQARRSGADGAPTLRDLLEQVRATTLEAEVELLPLAERSLEVVGSRPAYRDNAGEKMAGIRAIPWTFGWTQMRLMLPVWPGLGLALGTTLSGVAQGLRNTG